MIIREIFTDAVPNFTLKQIHKQGALMVETMEADFYKENCFQGIKLSRLLKR